MTRDGIVFLAILLEAAIGLALGLPGHLSRDSLTQLYEARTLEFISFQPPMMSLLLRVFDGWLRGTALFVVVDQLLLSTAFVLLFVERRLGSRKLALVAASLIVLNPLLIAYTGIVWKDVLMSHLAALGYVCLYVADRRVQRRKRIMWVVPAILTLALAASLRQHALILAIPGIVYAAILIAKTYPARIGLATVFVALAVGVNVAIVGLADSLGTAPPRTEAGLRTLATFDLTGIAANGGSIPDARIAAQIQAERVPFYTPLRNDVIPWPHAKSALARMDTPALLALWRDAITRSPRAYLAHRVAHFEGLLWGYGKTPLCDSIFTGTVSSFYVPTLGRDIVPELELQIGSTLRDRRFERFQQRLLSYTLTFNHAFWSLVLIAAAVALAFRGGADALILLAASAMVFALGFGVIGISCEFRYIYILPVAATLLSFALVVGQRQSASNSL